MPFRQYLLHLGIACSILFLLPSCSDIQEGKSLAEEALLSFHHSYNSQNFMRIYDDSHKDFKSASSEEDFLELMGAIFKKLGPQTSTVNTGWHVNSHNLKTYVTLTQNTTFETGKGVETFVYRIQDDRAKLLEYNINSKDLIIR